MADAARSFKLKAQRMHRALRVQWSSADIVVVICAGMAIRADLPQFVEEHWRTRVA